MVRYHKGEFPKKAFSLESTAELEKNIANAMAITIVRLADKFANEKVIMANGSVYKKEKGKYIKIKSKEAKK